MASKPLLLKKNTLPQELLHNTGLRSKHCSSGDFNSRKVKNILDADLSNAPIHDLAYMAQPGIHSRVSKNFSVVASKDKLKSQFIDVDEIDDDIVDIEGGFTGPLIAATLVSICPALQYGFNNANMNTPSQAMRLSLGIPGGQESSDSDVIWGFCISVFCLGALIGCSMVAVLADKSGRKRTLLLLGVTFILGAVLEALSAYTKSWYLMVGGRVVGGVASGATTVAVPLYLGEIAPAHLRGALGTCFQLSAVIAMLFAQVLGLPMIMGSTNLWPPYVLLITLPGIVLLCAQSYLVRSPKWLAGRSDAEFESAVSIVASLRGVDVTEPGIRKELQAMRDTSRKGEGGATGGGLLKDKATRRGLQIAIVSSISQQLSGINNVFNYSSIFLTQNGLKDSMVMVIAVAMNVGNVVISLAAGALMDRMGRKSLMLYSSVGMIASGLVLTFALVNAGQAWTSAVAVLAVVSFVACFGIGLGPIPWLVAAELIPAHHTAQASAISASFNWLTNFIIGQTFPSISASLGAFCFVPNCILMVVFVLYILRFMPETRGKTLDEIQEELLTW